MSSSKQQARRRAQRTPQRRQAGPPPRRDASPEVLIAAAVIVALLVVGLIAAAKLTDTSSETTPALSSGRAIPGSGDVERMLNGIPQHGNVLGSTTAPVTLVEYLDLQCPYCQQFETQVMPDVIRRYVRSGELKVEARVLAFIGPDSQRGQAAAIAAADQGKEFNLIALFYANQGGENSGWLSEATVRSVAASVPGLDLGALRSASGSASVTTQARRYVTQANADGLTRTPGIYVGRTGSTLKPVGLSSPTDEQSLADAINAALG